MLSDSEKFHWSLASITARVSAGEQRCTRGDPSEVTSTQTPEATQ